MVPRTRHGQFIKGLLCEDVLEFLKEVRDCTVPRILGFVALEGQCEALRDRLRSPDVFFPKSPKVLRSRRRNGCEDTVTLLKSGVIRSCTLIVLIIVLAVLKLREIIRVKFLNPWHRTRTTLPESHGLLASGQLVMAELLPTGVASGRTTAHGHLLRLPVDLRVVLPKPGVS